MSVTDNPGEFIADLLSTGYALLRATAEPCTEELIEARSQLDTAIAVVAMQHPRWTPELVDAAAGWRVATDRVAAAQKVEAELASPPQSWWRRLLGRGAT